MGEIQKNVYELAQERLHIIFKEFDNFFASKKATEKLFCFPVTFVQKS